MVLTRTEDSMTREPAAATTTGGEVGLRDRKKARTRQEILDSASELFAERGYENAHTAAIAQRAEVSEATLFRYFPSKADLAVDRQRLASLTIVSAIEARPVGENPFEAVSAVARSSVGSEFFTEKDRADTEQLLAHPELSALAFLIILESAGRLAEDFARRLGSGASDCEASVLAHAVLGAVIANIEDWIVRGSSDPQQGFVDHIEVLRPILE
ncbi:MAG: AcrR family transcriptional regulator [Candidatus Aldehydirespiratoraceae bacterium]